VRELCSTEKLRLNLLMIFSCGHIRMRAGVTGPTPGRSGCPATQQSKIELNATQLTTTADTMTMREVLTTETTEC
jgi:hypothetical protein